MLIIYSFLKYNGTEPTQSWKKTEVEVEFVKVKKRALERLTTEVMQLHDILPKILNSDILESFQKLDALETIVEKKANELEQLRMDCEHYKARLEAAQADCVRERMEKLNIRQQLNDAKQQLLQQAEYCTEMGAAVCTLLWSVSNNEEAVKNILGSAQAVKFFTIAGQTMESFVHSLNEDSKHQDMDSDESQFVLGLAGIVTNVAALAIGREFLVGSNQVLLDTMIQLLRDMKPGCCTKLKVLMLMSLYNISINMKGVKYISENAGFFPLLWWLLNVIAAPPPSWTTHLTTSNCYSRVFLQVATEWMNFWGDSGTLPNPDPDPEVCFHVLRLLQSMIMEPEILTKSALEIRDSLPLPRILLLSKSRNKDLQILAQELLDDLRVLEGTWASGKQRILKKDFQSHFLQSSDTPFIGCHPIQESG
ncbi:heat shock factor 2-binding protein isoform X3 [Crotalus tigris]|uniref:heat shock factor 2-binding protein isoform X3 n=1 Tax=Crotalus tigris TaxID=88082 RepID=UPI00192F903F|nr:heat shock factor 2-binding protein isoform X3 [Crotalus tigris]